MNTGKQNWVSPDVTFNLSSTDIDTEGVGRERGFNGNVYRWVQNKESAALVLGMPVCHDPAQGANFYNYVYIPASGTLNYLAGLAMSAIPAGGYGWIMVQGYYASGVMWQTNTSQATGLVLQAVAASSFMQSFSQGSVPYSHASLVSTSNLASFNYPIMGAPHCILLGSVTDQATSSSVNRAVLVRCLTV